jgi:phosphoglycolate phosphatase-like HAD superfamily hydrolase
MKSTTERTIANSIEEQRRLNSVCFSNVTGLFTALLNDVRLALKYIAPDLLRAACSRLGISPAELIYVKDSRADAFAARPVPARRANN